MSHFERTEGSLDNLGKNNGQFIPVDEIADPSSHTPDEILMENEENNLELKDENLTNVFDIDDIDDEPSNWEVDVEMGKYDDFKIEKTQPVVEVSPIHTQARSNVVRIEEMKGREQMERYWDEPRKRIDNAKPKRPQDNHQSIRFDGAV